VPVFAADVKGDLSGIAAPGKPNRETDRRLGLIPREGYQQRGYPVAFWDVYGKSGHPVRTTVSEMGPLVLANLLELSPGYLSDARRLAAEDEARRLAESTSIRPEQAHAVLNAARSTPLAHSVRIADVARRQNVALLDLFRAAGVGDELPSDAVVSTELELKYAGYFERERAQADKLRRMGAFALEESLPYDDMRSLSYEARQKLGALRPRTLAHAASVPGVSPTDLQNLVIEIEKRRRHDPASARAIEPR